MVGVGLRQFKTKLKIALDWFSTLVYNFHLLPMLCVKKQFRYGGLLLLYGYALPRRVRGGEIITHIKVPDDPVSIMVI